ncbi:hypothetical protein C8Q70DRAFT_225855 [Cubamyces menziesii]|nr:hypothetical protein C8Q70DRAFT_225855 [Cubamyces menziesii]
MQATSSSIQMPSDHIHLLPIHSPRPSEPRSAFATILDWADDTSEPMVPRAVNPSYWRVGGVHTQYLIAYHREARWSYDWYRYDLEREAEPSSNIAPPWPPFKAQPPRLFEAEVSTKAYETALTSIVEEEGLLSAEEEPSPSLTSEGNRLSRVSSFNSGRISMRRTPELRGTSVGPNPLESQSAPQAALVAASSLPGGVDARFSKIPDIFLRSGPESVPRSAATTSNGSGPMSRSDGEGLWAMADSTRHREMG